MKLLRENIVSLALTALAFIAAAALYGQMPNEVPIHWNVQGNVDDAMAKPLGPFLAPLLTLGVWTLLVAVGRISPKGFDMDRFRRAYQTIVTAVVALLAGISLVTTLAATGVAVNIGVVVPVGVGLLLMVIGNLMGKVTRNFFVGIRTPWTLASEEVWLRTHRVGGKLFVLAGLISVVTALLGLGPTIMIGTLVFASLFSVVYSYVVYRKVEGVGPPSPNGAA